mgnify:CR=1 FL=1
MAITAGDNLNSVAASQQVALASNYIDFATAGSSDGWAQQYLPDLMDKEAEVFGPRTISGFFSSSWCRRGYDFRPGGLVRTV